MPNVNSLGATVTQTMLDDQKTVMHITPLHADNTPGVLNPAQPVPTYAVSGDATVTIDPTIDPTGMSCAVIGVKGTVSGNPTVTASYTNADGTVATGAVVFTITQDPAELDVTSFDVTVDTPVAQ
jgi:hypothetical protein